jgi:hypothetical protein
MSCKRCGTRTNLWCLGCERVQYCGASCQRADWTGGGGHASTCGGGSSSSLIGEGTLVHMVRRAPGRFGRDLFWRYVQARNPTADEFVMDLADEEGIDDTNRLEWLRARDKILRWMTDETTVHVGIQTNVSLLSVMEAIAKHNFVPLAIRLMTVADIGLLYYGRALHVAAISGSLDVLKLFLARVSELGGPSSNIIYYAARHGQAEALRILLRDGRFDPNVKGGRAIVTASKHGHAEAVRVLLADPRVDPAVDENDAIRLAVIEKHAEVVRILLADPRVDPSDVDNEAISVAVTDRSMEIVQMLLADPRVDPNYRSSEVFFHTETPRDEQMLRMFLAHPRIKLWTEILDAMVDTHAPDIGIVRMLLQDGRLDPTEGGSNHILYDAVQYKHADVVRALLEDGRADPRAENYAAFKKAFRSNLWEVMREFLRDGRVNAFQKDDFIRRILAAPNQEYHHLLRVFLEDPRAKRVFSKEDAQNVLDTQPNIFPEFRSVLENYIREIQRGQPLDDSEPPVKMMKELLWN